MKNLIERLRLPEPVYVTRPVMPALETFVGHLKGIWQRHYLTNHGPVHAELERRLREYLAAEHVSLFSNGTAALMVGLRALGLEEGEVITTPFTFPATPHAASWSGLTPSFCDIDPDTFTMDPGRIESLIGPDTKAILAVHVFGLPCDVGAIQEIADKHGLRVIYDAAHAFGVKYHGRHLAEYGDMAMLSFHATKVFTTLEGGGVGREFSRTEGEG